MGHTDTNDRRTIVVHCPGSKSMTQRALIISALAQESTTIAGALRCDDSRILTNILQALGTTIRWQDDTIDVTPHPIRHHEQPLFCQNAGTAMRFSACLSLIADGPIHLDGDERMRERPIGPLGAALGALGVDIAYPNRSGMPPVILRKTVAPREHVTLDISLSSQYASGLMMIAPRLEKGLTISLGQARVSLPYLRMTAAMMKDAGADISWPKPEQIIVKPGVYTSREIAIEPDWSTAAFILGAGYLTGNRVEIPRLCPAENSLQGDARFSELLLSLQSSDDRRLDICDTPDLIAPLAAIALFARGTTEIRNVAHARVKECDRIAVLCREFRRLGAKIDEFDDGLRIFPLDPRPANGSTQVIEMNPENDHRMAMAFGLVSQHRPAIRVQNPECVTKSYPDFWTTLERFRPGASV